VLVAIDKFTKWIEYKPIASLTSAKAVEFIQDIIVTPLVLLPLKLEHNIISIGISCVCHT
jgi:hypothetical protein